MGSIPGSGRSPGGRNGNPLQYSCLENPMDRGAWQATVHGVAKSQMQLKRLSTHAHIVLLSAIHQHEWPEAYTCPLPPEPPSHCPSHPTTLGCHRALGLSSLRHAGNCHWLPILHMGLCMFQCYSLNTSHPLLSPQSPQVCSLRLCLHCCLVNRFISVIFLDSVYMH